MNRFGVLEMAPFSPALLILEMVIRQRNKGTFPCFFIIALDLTVVKI